MTAKKDRSLCRQIRYFDGQRVYARVPGGHKFVRQPGKRGLVCVFCRKMKKEVEHETD